MPWTGRGGSAGAVADRTDQRGAAHGRRPACSAADQNTSPLSCWPSGHDEVRERDLPVVQDWRPPRSAISDSRLSRRASPTREAGASTRADVFAQKARAEIGAAPGIRPRLRGVCSCRDAAGDWMVTEVNKPLSRNGLRVIHLSQISRSARQGHLAPRWARAAAELCHQRGVGPLVGGGLTADYQ